MRDRMKLIPIVLVLLVVANGCTRRFFRDFADKQVAGLMDEKNIYPFWQVGPLRVYPDPRSRFADGTNPDFPPRPPDDPAVDLLSPNPQPPGKSGVALLEGEVYLQLIAKWDAKNREEAAVLKAKEDAANPPPATDVEQAAFLQVDPKKDETPKPIPNVLPTPMPNVLPAPMGMVPTPSVAETPTEASSYETTLLSQAKTYLLKLEQASELGLFNSREYQDRFEDLYLAALPVTLERFAFVAQFFATNETIREYLGQERRGPNQSADRWNVNSSVGFFKLFPTGGTLLLQLANRLTIEFGEGKPNVGISTLTLQIAQPFLRGGGYAVNLEPLTQAERNLVYALRSFARFRKIWFAYLATGGDISNSPLTFAGLTLRGVGPTFIAPSQGYLPTLLLQGLRQNEEANITALENILKLFQAFKEGGDISDLQVGQVEQQLLRSRAQLLQRRLDVENGLDNLKLQLGVPTPLPLELDDSTIRPLRKQFDRYQQIFVQFDEVRDRSAQANAPEKVNGLRPVLRELSTSAAIVRGTAFAKSILERWQFWEGLPELRMTAELRSKAAERRRLLDLKADSDSKRQPFPASDETKLRVLESDIDLGELEQSLRRYEAREWEKEPTLERRERMRDILFRDVTASFVIVLADARNERFNEIRTKWPELPPLCVSGVDLLTADLDVALAAASQAALTYRLDLMNARGQLVDSWRQIAVRSNSLLGVFNLGYNLDSLTPDGVNRPLSFSGDRTRHQITLNAELPLVRRLERNQYRTALIAFQRQRRALMASEDFILNQIRVELRQLRVFAENYKIQQRAVELAYSQVENSLDVFSQPPIPSQGSTNNSGNAAALTQQLLNAQQSLPQAQNALYTVWISYLNIRIQLYRDLELMPLDARGVWIDECINRDCPPRPESIFNPAP